MTRLDPRFMRPTVAASALLAAASAIGCDKILGLHALDGGPELPIGDDGGASSSASGAGSGGSGTSSGSSSGADCLVYGCPGGYECTSTRGSPSCVPVEAGAPAADSGSGSGGGGSGTSSAGGGIGLTGNACALSTDTHWAAAVYLVQCDIRVSARLTIDPGAVLKFGTGHSMTVSTGGTVNASGTAAAPIVFTSIRDNANGASVEAGSGAPGDWDGVTLSASGSTFDYCGFYYGGGSETAALKFDGSNNTVTHSVFAHDKGSTDNISLAVAALDAGNALAGSTIQNNTFYDNQIPLRIGPNVSLDDTNVFDNSAAAPANPLPNTYNAIDYAAAGSCGVPILGMTTWSATHVPFLIGNASNTGLCVNNGGQLMLGPNVVLKFFPGGMLQIDGTSTLKTGIGDVFTSYRDSVHGGDTNPGAGSPMAGDWDGISVGARGSTFDSCGFYYAGGDDNPALALNGVSNSTVTHCIFGHNRGTTDSISAVPALDASTGAAGTLIQGNTFFDNRIPLRIGSNVSLDDTNLFDNGAAAPANPLPNTYNAIDYAAAGSCGVPILGMTKWSATHVPFLIGNAANTGLCVTSGGQLTLDPNVVLKFFPGGTIQVDSGSTLKTGSGDVFTSYKDAAHGGDTDPGAGAPMAGDWSGVLESNVCQTSIPGTTLLYSTPGCP